MSQTCEWEVEITSGICQWITDKGGPTGLTIPDIFILIERYLQHTTTPPFIPTVDEIFGGIEYYLGHITQGNNLTGCEFA